MSLPSWFERPLEPRESLFPYPSFESLVLESSSALLITTPSLECLISTAPADLCSICADFDWVRILTEWHSKVSNYELDGAYPDATVIIGTTVGSIRASECPMCKLFSLFMPKNIDMEHDKNQKCYIAAFSAGFALGYLNERSGSDQNHASEKKDRLDQDRVNRQLKENDFPVLGMIWLEEVAGEESTNRDRSQRNLQIFKSVCETGSLAILDPLTTFGARHISSHGFNVEFVERSIRCCITDHSHSCPSTNKQPVQSLKVIDCKTRSIVAAGSTCQYIALSYLWGQDAAEPLNSSIDSKGQRHLKLPNSPKVIEDSIKVTLQLGFQYLWVDRYCIPQDNSAENRDQIKQMDLIYANAFITIIAAAGEGPYYGLPGVSSPRKLQQYVKIGGRIIGSTFPHSKQ